MPNRTMRWLVPMSLVVPVAIAAATDAPPPSRPLAGFARYEFNKWLFFPCPSPGVASGKSAGIPFIDATPKGVLFRAIQQRWQQSADPLRGVYLEFSGYEENQRVTATELSRALGWVESCSQRPTNVEASALAWAAGNEPSWKLALDDRTATFGGLDIPTMTVSPSKRADTQTLTLIAKDPAFRAEFSAELCVDTMSEAAFGRRVTVAFNGRLFTGCGFVR